MVLFCCFPRKERSHFWHCAMARSQSNTVVLVLNPDRYHHGWARQIWYISVMVWANLDECHRGEQWRWRPYKPEVGRQLSHWWSSPYSRSTVCCRACTGTNNSISPLQCQWNKKLIYCWQTAPSICANNFFYLKNRTERTVELSTYY